MKQALADAPIYARSRDSGHFFACHQEQTILFYVVLTIEMDREKKSKDKKTPGRQEIE